MLKPARPILRVLYPSMKWLLKSFKLLRVLSHIVLGMVLAGIAFSRAFKYFFPQLPPHIVQWWSAGLCTLLKVRVHVSGEVAKTTVLYVANHISWIDIFALLSVSHVRFVAKHEVKSWVALGWLSARSGTLFVRRGQFEAAALASDVMAKSLCAGDRILFFPEGTSTDGTGLKRFHARMFQAAIQTELPVQPIALHYPTATGLNQVVPFIGEQGFISHLWQVLGEQEIIAQLHYCPVISSVNMRRRELADQAYFSVAKILFPNNLSLLESQRKEAYYP